jgi:hypothetical protein
MEDKARFVFPVVITAIIVFVVRGLGGVKGQAESGDLFGGSRRKIAKKIAKNKCCYANTLRPLKDAVERR